MINRIEGSVLLCTWILLFTLSPCAQECGKEWQWADPLPFGMDPGCLVYGNGRFVSGGSCLVSEDGISWKDVKIPVLHRIQTMVFDGTRFVALSRCGDSLISQDGLKWEMHENICDGTVYGIAYGNGRYVGVGHMREVMISFDGVNWTRHEQTERYFEHIAFGNSRFVAAIAGELWSSDDGIIWSEIPGSPTGIYRGIAFGSGGFVAVGGRIACSPDGVTWTQLDGLCRSFNGVTWSPLGYAATCEKGKILTSPDGMNWTEHDTGAEHYLYAIAGSENRYVSVGNMGTTVVGEGISNWICVSSCVNQAELMDVTCGENGFVAVGANGEILSSADGVSWTRSEPLVEDSLNAVEFGGGRYVAAGDWGNILTSIDGKNWSKCSYTSQFWIRDFAYDGTNFIGVGDNLSVTISSDSENWTQISLGVTGTGMFWGVACGGGLSVAVGWAGRDHQGVIYTSSDGVGWVQRSVPQCDELLAVAYGAGRFVAVGADGTALSSDDGVTWIKRASLTYRLMGITYAGAKFIVVSWGSFLFTSPDGESWQRDEMGMTGAFTSVCHGMSKVVGVGMSEDSSTGSIMISKCEGCAVSCRAGAEPSSGIAPLEVSFSGSADTYDCQTAASLNWLFGDGAESAEQNPRHTYLSSGVYNWTLTVVSGEQTCTKSGAVTVDAPCTVACTASAAPASGIAPLQVAFSSFVTPTGCSGGPTYEWDFGDGTARSSDANPSHTYAASCEYAWILTINVGGVICKQSGLVSVSARIPGDCDGDSAVSIAELQKAINMFLGSIPPECGVDCDGDGKISIGEVQKVINAFLGMTVEC